ncbi:RrF2 family transcriptional regulator [Burkholderia sp. BCC1996]|uniref:RrF2 family transcriptional regulator n=1 Tax=unclassified Burkholderia TaxID=2613784 RepID=UPI0039EECCC5
MTRDKQPTTSNQIAEILGTNSAVVRRTLAGLRRAGYVASLKGHGGGWSIACDLEAVSLFDIYSAIGSERIFAIGFDHTNPDCAVERVVNAAVDDVLHQAEALLIEKFKDITLGDLARDFEKVHRISTATVQNLSL